MLTNEYKVHCFYENVVLHYMQENLNDIFLIFRPDWGVQVDARKFPILCPNCKNYHSDIYEHTGSRYGQVGSIKCSSCLETLHLVDNDNIVDEIHISQNNKKTSIDFKEFFHFTKADFVHVSTCLNLDLIQLFNGRTIWLNELIETIESKIGRPLNGAVVKFPATEDQRKWLELTQTKAHPLGRIS